MTLTELCQAASILPLDERWKLIESVMATIPGQNTETLPFQPTPELLDELARRVSELKAAPDDEMPWAEFVEDRESW